MSIPNSNKDETQERRAFIVTIVFLVAITANFLLSLSQAFQTNAWQHFVRAGLVLAFGIVAVIAAIRIRRGRTENGVWLLISGFLFALIGTSLLLAGFGLILAVIELVLTGGIAAFVLPKGKRNRGFIVSAIAAALTYGLDFLPLAYRFPAPVVLKGALPAIAGVVVLVVGLYIARQAWIDGHIRNRIIVLLSAVLLPILAAFTWYNIQAQTQDMEKEFTNKAESVAISGAATIGHLLEEAIANGDLTKEQVFDTSYVQYWQFDSAAYEFDGDPASLNKFHTAYDAYTDEKWQGLLDSYLNQNDFVFTIPVDKNGYLPTHNTRWSSWDGSPATDRSKRIFNDPVGLAAAQNTQPTLVQEYPRPGTGETLLDVSAPIYVNGEHWGAFRVGTLLAENNLFAQTSLESATRRSLFVSGLLAIGIIASAWFLGRSISKPLEKLTEGASQLASGQFGEVVEVPDTIELKTLANAFNDMTVQLKDLVGSLEQRVAERTQNLELAAEVGRSVSQVRDLEVMLKDACDLILKEFDLYYVQVYLTDPSQTNLVLEAGTGEVGAQLRARGHSLQLNTGSINGRAAMEKRTVVISDTAQSASFQPNPLLPDTRGEMAVPLIVADKVVGVLDMQSSHPGTLTEEVLPAFEALAGQLAVAIQNANLIAEAEQARAEVEAQARRLVRTGWRDYMDAIHTPEEVGFVFDRNEISPFEDTGETELPENGQVVSAPISLTGEMLGSLVVEIDNEAKSEQTAELVNTIARQVSQQLENLRLLESSERYRFEAEQAARRQTREGWQEYIQSRTEDSLGYLYDLKKVRPHSNGKDDPEALTLPLKARDETVGKLAIQGVEPDDKETFDLANAVAERLGAHIDSLRLSDQTRQALAQAERLFDASRNLTQSEDLQGLVAAAVHTIDIPVVNRALLLTFEYDSEGEIEQLTVVGNWWNETGHEVTPIGTRYSQDVVQLMPMFVSPTPVFFNDAYNDERVDVTTMELVKKLNLRAVAVLPLHLGENQIGALLLEAEEPHTFTPNETRLFESLAPQIATIVENRQQYEQAQRQADREAMLNTINQKIQSATSVEAVLQIAARELGHALGAPMTIAQLSMKEQKN